jgi:thioredoxin-dependent peroxiredoxin
MAAKKKIAKSVSKAVAKAAKKPAPAAKPAKKAPPKAAAPSKKALAAKPVKAAKPKPPTAPASNTAAKPVKATKPASAAKAAVTSSKSAKPARDAKPAKPPAAASKSAKSSTTDAIVKTVKGAASKLAQVAAKAAVKLLDADAGRSAPSFELTDEKGETVSSESLAGTPYLLYFYPKDDTPGCTKEACDIRDNIGRFGQQGLRVLGVSPDSEKSHAKFGKKYGLPFTLLSDPDKTLATAYGVWAMKQNYGKEYMGIVRSTFLVGADGEIKKAYRGVKVDGHVDAVLADAQALL